MKKFFCSGVLLLCCNISAFALPLTDPQMLTDSNDGNFIVINRNKNYAMEIEYLSATENSQICTLIKKAIVPHKTKTSKNFIKLHNACTIKSANEIDENGNILLKSDFSSRYTYRCDPLGFGYGHQYNAIVLDDMDSEMITCSPTFVPIKALN